MADPHEFTPDPLSSDFMPSETDLRGDEIPPDKSGTPIALNQFLYIGKGCTLDEFSTTVNGYDFGSVPPSHVILHHTFVPSTRFASHSSGWRWDSGEDGMSEQQIYAKRLKSIESLRAYYAQNPKNPARPEYWDRGPHLFIDERWIWLFTPMFNYGIHAGNGNVSFNRQGGVASYSVGIEVVGCYDQVVWPQPVAERVSHVILTLKKKLGTFEIRYNRGAGGISSHRDWGKPGCPGAKITNDYYLAVFRAAELSQQHPSLSKQITPETGLLGSASGSLQSAIRAVRSALPANSEYLSDVEIILNTYWELAPTVGVDPFIAAAQCIFETGGLTSGWSARPKRNPAGLGVHAGQGLSFASWNAAVKAHLGQILAFCLTDDQATPEQRAMMQQNPRHGALDAALRGSVRSLNDLANRWAPDATYGSKLAQRAEAIRAS